MDAPPTGPTLPGWAEEMRQVFRAGATSQFVLHGNVFDLVPAPDGKGGTDWVSLADFLTGTMFQPFDVVIRYDRGRGRADRAARTPQQGATPYKGVKEVQAVPQGRRRVPGRPRGVRRGGRQAWTGSTCATSCRATPSARSSSSDRILAFARVRTKVQDGKVVAAPLKVAVILDYAHFIAPQGDPIYVADLSQTLIQIQDWAANPEVTGSFVATVLITENLARPQPRDRGEPLQREDPDQPADRRRDPRLRGRPRARRRRVREGLRGDPRGAGRQARGPLPRLDPLPGASAHSRAASGSPAPTSRG